MPFCSKCGAKLKLYKDKNENLFYKCENCNSRYEYVSPQTSVSPEKTTNNKPVSTTKNQTTKKSKNKDDYKGIINLYKIESHKEKLVFRILYLIFGGPGAICGLAGIIMEMLFRSEYDTSNMTRAQISIIRDMTDYSSSIDLIIAGAVLIGIYILVTLSETFFCINKRNSLEN